MENALGDGEMREAQAMREVRKGRIVETPKGEANAEARSKLGANSKSGANADTERWEAMFSFVLAYRERTGAIPAGTLKACFSPDGRDVGAWLTRQRQLYAKGKMAEDRKHLLLSEGIILPRGGGGQGTGRLGGRVRYIQKPKKDHWEACYEAAKEWYEREGNLLIPSRYVTDTGLKLGSWISMLRTMYNECPSAHRLLTPGEIYTMEAIGMVWRIQRQPSWEEWLEQVEIYVKEHGDLSVPYRYEQNGFRLSTWLQSQRANYKAGLLSRYRIRSLERCGMVWSLDKRRDWDTYYTLAQRYYGERGTLLVPDDYYTEEGYALGAWIAQQRERYKCGKDRRDGCSRVESGGGNEENGGSSGSDAKIENRPGLRPLTAEEVSRLEGIGMVWENVHEHRWEMMFETVQEYYAQWGKVPKRASCLESPDGRRAGPWVVQQRTRIRSGGLDAERIRRLKEIGIVAGGDPCDPEALGE